MRSAQGKFRWASKIGSGNGTGVPAAVKKCPGFYRLAGRLTSLESVAGGYGRRWRK